MGSPDEVRQHRLREIHRPTKYKGRREATFFIFGSVYTACVVVFVSGTALNRTASDLQVRRPVRSSTLQVESTERDVHSAEESDDFIDQFHDFNPAIVVVFSVTHVTKRSLLLGHLSINSFVIQITKYLKYLFSFI